MEENKMYYKLENGSDIRGIALEGVEGENVNLTPEIAKVLAHCFAHFVAEKTGKETDKLVLGVGHDSRLSAPMLKAAVLEGMQEAGCVAVDCGLSSTPSMFMATVLPQLDFDGTVMITASHLPFNRNGLKFFTKEGGLEHADIHTITTWATEARFTEVMPKKEVRTCELLKEYSAHLCSVIRKDLAEFGEKPLEGLHIVVDAGNGAGGFFESQVLAPLGADTTGSVFLEPDGSFPNHIPNPENKEAMEAIQKATVESGADLGIIFDTDVDRSAAVFSNGQEINRNAIIALMGAIVAKEHPGSTVVTDSVTSDELAVFLEQDLGLKHHRFKRGYKNVINESIRLNEMGEESCLAIETSGHGALKENYFLDDGAYMSVKIICELARCKAKGLRIDDMIQALGHPKDSGEFRFKIKTEDFKTYGKEVLEQFDSFIEESTIFTKVPVNHEGIRVNFNEPQAQGWMLLRMSLHDPILPLNIETKEEGGVAFVKDSIRPFFEKFDKLDISSIR